MAIPVGLEVARAGLLGAPAWFLPRTLLPGCSIFPGDEWVRAVFANGRHRLITEELGEHDPWRISQGLLEFDRWARVGRLVAIVNFDMTSGQAHTEALLQRPVLAVARLASVSVGGQYEGQDFLMQRWVNLGKGTALYG